MRDSDDAEVFSALRGDGNVIMTKDSDFIDLVTRLGPPPQVLLVAIGNCANDELCRYLTRAFPRAIELLVQGEPVVELRRIEAP
jgi:predicted nuclease of predicted toxin-antitoxin system